MHANETPETSQVAGAASNAELDRKVLDISIMQKSPDPQMRKTGRELLINLSRQYGHIEVEAAQARAGLLPADHVAWASNPLLANDRVQRTRPATMTKER